MKNLHILLFLLVSFGVSPMVLHAQLDELEKEAMVEKLIDNVRKEGFHGVSINTAGRTLVVFYENRIYQNEVFAIKEMLQILRPTFVKYYDYLTLIAKRRNVPMVSITIRLSDYEDYR
ncbi:MAG: hypothetical protein AAFP02_25245, partial [Bacteroidota bacterium]